MARKTVRRNGRYITIDTKTGKEIKPGTVARQAAASLYRGAKTLPSKAKRLVKEVGDTLVYSDKPDKKGRPQTIQQERVRRETADSNRKTGQKATLNGKPVVWKGNKWVPAPATPKKRGMSNIPPKEAQPGSPSYVKPKPTTTTRRNVTPTPPTAPKKVTVAEGRMTWARKYSGKKYKGTAIGKEAKAYLSKQEKKKQLTKAQQSTGAKVLRKNNSSIG